MSTTLTHSEIKTFFHFCNRVLDAEGLPDLRPPIVDAPIWNEILDFHSVKTIDGAPSSPALSKKSVGDLQRIALAIALHIPAQITDLHYNECMNTILSAVISVIERRGYIVAREGRCFPWPAFKAWEELANSRQLDRRKIDEARADTKKQSHTNGFYEE